MAASITREALGDASSYRFSLRCRFRFPSDPKDREVNGAEIGLISLDPKCTLVTIRPRWVTDLPLVAALLVEMRETWPDTTASVNGYLSTLLAVEGHPESLFEETELQEEDVETALQTLSERDRKIAEAWRENQSSGIIASSLGLRPHTIENTVTRLRANLGASVIPYHLQRLRRGASL